MERIIETVTATPTELTRFTTKYLHSLFIFITHNSYMFRPYIVAIFGELQIYSTCSLTRQLSLYLPEDGHGVRSKHEGVVYNEYEITVKEVGSEIVAY
jgi:hypothetical protein